MVTTHKVTGNENDTIHKLYAKLGGLRNYHRFMKALIFHWLLRMDTIWVRLNGIAGGLLMFPNERKGIHLGN